MFTSKYCECLFKGKMGAKRLIELVTGESHAMLKLLSIFFFFNTSQEEDPPGYKIVDTKLAFDFYSISPLLIYLDHVCVPSPGVLFFSGEISQEYSRCKKKKVTRSTSQCRRKQIICKYKTLYSCTASCQKIKRNSNGAYRCIYKLLNPNAIRYLFMYICIYPFTHFSYL